MTTDKTACLILADVLHSQGVRDVVVSPGSRNAPLTLAFDDKEEMRLTVVTDERSAAFVALGLAQASRRPVAVVCTSGSALLNFSPAVAEAYYQGIPLIVISADRPQQWIDQDDSQTIRQFEALDNYVKRSYDIPDCEMPEQEQLWLANRLANDACLTALSPKQGPVHINVQLHAPLTRPGEPLPPQRVVETVVPEDRISREQARALAEEADGARILVVAGFMQPDARLNRALAEFSTLPNVYVLHETIANLHIGAGCSAVDTLIGSLSDDERRRMAPDLVITVGGALVSRFIKQYLRAFPPRLGHWSVGHSHTTVDCFKSLTKRIMARPASFFSRFGGALATRLLPQGYAAEWEMVRQRAYSRHDAYVGTVGWSDMRAMQAIFSSLRPDINVQLSNGTPVRYAQLLQRKTPHAEFCNRGVSGIDGCTSTAVGASLAYGGLTLLITGDLSFTYDLSALTSAANASRLRIIVMCNGGGGIFRFVATTASLEEGIREKYFCTPPAVDPEPLAAAFGLTFMSASCEEELRQALPRLLGESDRAVILAVRTPAEESATILRNYFNTISDK